MTSEEVKELLRQLSKDTEEVGDIRSRTVRIRLEEPEPEPEPAPEPEPEEEPQPSRAGRRRGGAEEPQPSRAGKQRGGAEEPQTSRGGRRRRRTDEADETDGPERPDGAEETEGREDVREDARPGKVRKVRIPFFGRWKKGQPGDEPSGDEQAPKSPFGDEQTDEGADASSPAGRGGGSDAALVEDAGAASADGGDEMDELVTRYMSEDEKKAYLEERNREREESRGRRRRGASAVEGGRSAERPRGGDSARNTAREASSRPDRTGRESSGRPDRRGTGSSRRAQPRGLKGRLAAFVERQMNTPVEPPAFETDAWMFRSGAAAGKGGGPVPSGEDGSQDQANPIKERSMQMLGFLERKGIGLRQLAVAGSIIVLTLLIIAIVLTVLGNRRKSARVTADEGLRITVEKEPSKWCQSGDVTLAVSADSPVQSISMNGEPLGFSGQGRVHVSFTAEGSPVDILVVSEDRTRTASVGFARIDSVDPEIGVFSQEDGTIAFDASDDASGVDKICYGTISGLSDVPSYQEYTQPFTPEKGVLYSYFVTDKAGNASSPVTTNLTPASAISLSRDEVSLFAGDTYQLELSVSPERAFLNGLEWSSSDETVASVSNEGLVSALKDGEAVITARGDGVADAECVIRVRSEVSVTVSAVGDMTLGEDAFFSTMNNFTAMYTMNGPGYFLENVRDIFAADDITFANLEGTLTDQGDRQQKEYAFRGDPSYVQVLTEGSVEAVTLANNHSYDYGEISHTDTQKYLDEAGVDWCEGDKIIIRDVSGVRMALIGIYVLAEGQAKAEQLESCMAAAKEAGAQLIVVAFHWGNERETKPDATQTYLGRLAIDLGADLVVGHHPHVLQGIEKYSGKYICYSLGNFCFGGNSNPSDKDTIIFQQTFRILRSGDVEDGGVSVIPCSVSSTPEWNNYQPTPATGEEAERIMTKLNDLCAPFKTSF